MRPPFPAVVVNDIDFSVYQIEKRVKPCDCICRKRGITDYAPREPRLYTH